jgi:hypothetical protein
VPMCQLPRLPVSTSVLGDSIPERILASSATRYRKAGEVRQANPVMQVAPPKAGRQPGQARLPGRKSQESQDPRLQPVRCYQLAPLAMWLEGALRSTYSVVRSTACNNLPCQPASSVWPAHFFGQDVHSVGQHNTAYPYGYSLDGC